MYEFTRPQPEDAAAIEALLDQAFGPGRYAKTSYRFRDGVDPIAELAQVARDHGRLVGTISYWPVVVGDDSIPALLLGPIAVDPELRGLGIGISLIRRTIAQARVDGHRLAVLVGDADYYKRVGFTSADDFGITMPGQPDRLMVKALTAGGLDGVGGPVRRWGWVRSGLMAA